jgi:hypothetical protein
MIISKKVTYSNKTSTPVFTIRRTNKSMRKFLIISEFLNKAKTPGHMPGILEIFNTN